MIRFLILVVVGLAIAVGIRLLTVDSSHDLSPRVPGVPLGNNNASSPAENASKQASLRTTTVGPFCDSSPGRKSRPTCGVRPSSPKKLPVTRADSTRKPR